MLAYQKHLEFFSLSHLNRQAFCFFEQFFYNYDGLHGYQIAVLYTCNQKKIVICFFCNLYCLVLHAVNVIMPAVSS